MTYGELLKEQTARLTQAGIPEPQADAFLLFEEAFSMNRMAYLMENRSEADPAGTDRFLSFIEKRLMRIPVQQILGRANFCGYDFFVNEHVLTPRFDTEVLVELALNRLLSQKESGKAGEKPVRILDMCTGSGCIGMSLYLLLKERGIGAEVTCVDLSEEALKVTEVNNQRLCEGKIRLRKSDLFAELEGEGCFDMIVSNPPYIRTDVIEELMPEVKEHEPMMALDGFGDGLYFYREIADKAAGFLKENGMIYLETGYDQGPDVKALFSKNGFGNANVHKDLAGLDRVVSAVHLPE